MDRRYELEREYLALLTNRNDLIPLTQLYPIQIQNETNQQIYIYIKKTYQKYNCLTLDYLDPTLYNEYVDIFTNTYFDNRNSIVALEYYERELDNFYKQDKFKYLYEQTINKKIDYNKFITAIKQLDNTSIISLNEELTLKELEDNLVLKNVGIELKCFPKLSSQLKLMQNDLLVVGATTGCVDCDTEYFNGNEWKKINDYTPKDKILIYNENGTAELSFPLLYHKYKCDKLWNIKTQYSVDMCVSDEHNIYYLNSNNELRNIKFSELHKIHDNNKYGFAGKFITTFKYDGKGIDLTDNEIKLMCAVICDGSFDKRYNSNSCRVNLKKKRKINELEKILNNCEIPYKKVTNNYGYTIFKFKSPRKEKEFTNYWYNCSNKQLQIICDNVLNWDGHIDYSKNKKIRKQFNTTIKTTADFIQFAFTSCGYKAIISKQDRRNKNYKSNNKIYKRKSVEYYVYISKRINPTILSSRIKTNIELYKTLDGYKYCFTTKTGMWIMRKNNKICITGNSGKSGFLLNLFNCLMYKYQCVYFNLEMSKSSIYRRLVAINADIPINAIDNPSDYQKDLIQIAKDSIVLNKVTIVHQINNVKDITKIIAKKKNKDKHTIIFIDHIGLLKSGTKKSLYEETTETIKELRQICLDYDCTIIAASQLNRTAYNSKEKTLNMLKDSGEIENSARKILLLYYAEENNKENLEPIMYVDIAKNDSGMTGVIQMKYYKIKQIYKEEI